MTIAEMLLQEFEVEAKNTRTTLERIPFALADFKPHEKSMPMGRLAMHVATLPHFGAAILNLDGMDLTRDKFPTLVFESTESTVTVAEQATEALRSALSKQTGTSLEQDWKMVWGDKPIAAGPRVLLYHTMFLNHLVHHRAQLGVYLRLNNLPVPPLYGPSADDKMGF